MAKEPAESTVEKIMICSNRSDDGNVCVFCFFFQVSILIQGKQFSLTSSEITAKDKMRKKEDER